MAPLLPRCLDSLVNQTLKEIEIICVDDGSTDHSVTIVQEYAERDMRVRLIRQANTGRAAARDAGINAATGEWLGFVDPDDYAELEMYETLLARALETGADIVQCAHAVFSLRDIPSWHAMCESATRYYAGLGRNDTQTGRAELLSMFFTGKISVLMWDKLFRRIPTGRTRPVTLDLDFLAVNGEDTLYVYEALLHCSVFAWCPQQLIQHSIGGPHSGFVPGGKFKPLGQGHERILKQIFNELITMPEWRDMRQAYVNGVSPGIFWNSRTPVPRLRAWVQLWKDGGIVAEHFNELPARQRYYIQAAFAGRWRYVRLLYWLKLCNRNFVRYKNKLLRR